MTLRHMTIFVSVYKNQGITKAARQLHLAQPSVSLAISELEKYYGVRLFERMGRCIFPTRSGDEFYGYALHIVSLFEEMEKKIKNCDTIGALRIGASITIGTHVLPAKIRQFREEFPQITVEAKIFNSAAIEQHILDNAIDLGLIETRPEHPDILCQPFMEDGLCAIVPSGHPLTAYKKVTLSQLAEYPFLMRERGSAGRDILEACFALEQLSVSPAWESASTQAIVKGVAQGLGVAVLPGLLVEKDIKEHTVSQIPLSKPLRRDFHIIYHKSKYLTSGMKAFIRLCGERKENCK